MKKFDKFMSEFERYDCDVDSSDSCEFNTESSEEFSQNTTREFDSEQANEFGATENVIKRDTTRDFFNSPGIIAPLGMSASELTETERKTDLSSLYETGSDGCGCGDGCGCDGDDCGCGYTDNSAETAQEFDPSDETAAVDEDYTNFYEPTEDLQTRSDDCGYGDGCGCDEDGCGCGYTDNAAETAQEFGVDLANDETAAVDYRTFSAQERCSLDDYEIISDVLGSEKELVKLYSTALCESAEEPLRNIIRENLVECANDQYATFEYMEKRGLYPTEEAPEEKITQAKQQFGPLCK